MPYLTDEEYKTKRGLGGVYREMKPGEHPALPLQERGVTAKERLAIKTLGPTDVRPIVEWLKERGYDARPTSGGQVALRKDTTGPWKVIDPSGFDWMDLPDVLNEVVSGVTTGAGIVAGTALGGPVGGVAGGGLAAGAQEAGRQFWGRMAGFKPTAGETAADIGFETGAGAAAPVVGALAGKALKGGGKLVKEGVKKALGKPAVEATEEAAEAAAKTVAKETPTEAAGKIFTEATPKQKAEAELSERIGRMTTQKMGEFTEKTKAVSDLAIEDPLERLWARQKEAFKTVVGRGVEPPDYTISTAGEFVFTGSSKFPKEAFKLMDAKKFNSFVDKMAEYDARQTLELAGRKDAWLLPLGKVKNVLKNRWTLAQDTLINKRLQVWDLINESKGGAFEVVFRKRDGTLRHMFASITPPVTSKSMARAEVAEQVRMIVDQHGIDAAKDYARLIARAAKYPRARLKEVNQAGEDALVDIIHKMQKVVQRETGLPYSPKQFGLRTVWDIEARNFKSIALDFTYRLRTVNPATGKIGRDISFLPAEAWGMGGIGHKIGRGLLKGGMAAKMPGEFAKKVAGGLGVGGPLGRMIPYSPALYGGELGYGIAGLHAAGTAAEVMGRWVVRGQPKALLSKMAARGGRAGQAAKTVLKAERERGIDGLTASLLAAMKIPEFRSLFEELLDREEEKAVRA